MTMTREDIIKIVRAMWKYKDCGYSEYEIREALDGVLKVLEQDPITKLKSDEDAPNNITEVRLGAVRNFVKDFPSVTPTRKIGKWVFTKTIFDKYGYTVECQSCHKKWKTYDEIRWKKENKFCPDCGAEMESEEC